MKRLPNTYAVDENAECAEVSQVPPTIIEDNEFSQFVTGQKNNISEEVKKKIRERMQDAGLKADVFLTAYVQKGMGRLAKIMKVLDTVDNELFQAWRINSMETDDLVDLFGELNNEKHKSVKEFAELSQHFERDKLTTAMNKLFSANDELSYESKEKIKTFFKEKVAV